METILDVQDLPEDRIEYLRNLIALWKKQDKCGHHQEPADKQSTGDLDDDIVFATHPSKVIGPLTRNEIYDHLA